MMNSRAMGPTPGDNSEIAIEGNFLEDCEMHGDGTGGCFTYVSSYNQFEILDISRPNDIRLLSTYYAEIARIIDIKVTQDNNWALINHELTNSELDEITNDDDANSGANRLDAIYVGNKTSPIKVAEWDNPPADSTIRTCMFTATGPRPIRLQHGKMIATYSSSAQTLIRMVEGSSGTFSRGPRYSMR